MKPNRDFKPSPYAAFRIATVYAVIGAIWIIGSGWLLHHLVHNASLEIFLETIKGWFYVFVTAFLLGLWLSRYFRRIRRATELLRKSESRFSSIFNHHLEAIAISRLKDGVFIDVNEAFVKLHGSTREEIVGRSAEDLQLWNFPNRTQIIAELQKKKSLVFEMNSRHKNGSVRNFLVSAQLTELEGVPCLLSTLIDLAESRQFEKMFQQSEERFRALFEQAAVGVAEVDASKGRFLNVNQKYCDIVGYSKEELLCMDFQSITYTDDLPLNLENVRQIKEGEIREFSLEKRYIRKDGTMVWVTITASPLWKQGEMPTQYVSIIKDITWQKNAEKALLESEEKFKLAFMTVPDAININRLEDGNYVSVSPSFTQMTGFTEADVLGKSSIDLNIWDDSKDRQRMVEGLTKDGIVRNLEAKFRKKNGQILYGLMSATLINLDNTPHLISVTRDITNRKKAEEAIQQSEQRLNFALKASHTGAWSLNLKNLTATRNLIHAQIFGYQNLDENWSIVKFLEHVVVEEREYVRKRLSAGISRIEDWNLECRIRRLDGEIRWIFIAGGYEQNESAGMVSGIVQDITERKLAEEKLLKEHMRFQHLFENSPSATWLEDFTGVIKWFDQLRAKGVMDLKQFLIENPQYIKHALNLIQITDVNQAAVLQLAAKSKEELLGSLSQLFDERAFSEFVNELEIIWLGKEQYEYESHNKKRNGEPLHVIVRITITKHEGHLDYSRVVVTGTDITEREMAEEKLRVREQRFAELLKNSFDTIVILDADGIQRYVSESAERVHGFTSRELTDISVIDEMIHPEDREHVVAAFNEIIENGEGGAQYRHKRKGGGWVHLEGRGTNQLHNPDIRGVVVNVRDITENKLAEQALLKSENRNRSLLEAIPDLIFVIDKEGRFIDFHANNPDDLFIAPEQFIGKHFSENLPAALATKTQEAIQQVFSTKQLQEFEYQMELSGLLSYFEARAVLSSEDQILIIVRNVTKRKKAELELSLAQKNLAEKEAQYRLIAENSTDLIYVYRTYPEPKYEYISPSCFQLLGYLPEEGYADPFAYHKFLNTPEGVERFSQFILNPEQPTTIEEVWKKKDGTFIWIEQVVSRKFDENGNLISFQSTVRDITKRKQVEEALQKEVEVRKILLRLATEFIAVPVDVLSDIVDKKLPVIGEFTGVDRIYVFKHNHSERTTSNTHEWCAEGITPEFENLQNVPFAIFEDMQQVFQKGGIVNISRINEMPEDHPMRSVLANQGIKSIVMAPLFYGTNNIGFIGFDAVKAEKSFTDQEISILRLLADIFSNVFVRQNTEAELNKHVNRLQFALKAARQSWFDAIVPTGEVTVSPEYSVMLGYKPEEFESNIGNWLENIHPDDRAKVQQMYQNILLSGNVGEIEYRRRTHTNDWKWIYTTGAVAERDPEGKPYRLTGIHMDITGRKQAEAVFQDIIDKNPMSIQILDLEGYTIQTNLAHTKLFSVKPPDKYSMFDDTQLLQMGFGDVFEKIKNGETVYFPDTYYNVHNIDPSFPDKPVWIKAVGFPLNDTNGKPEFYVLMHENVTERKKAEAELIASEKKFREISTLMRLMTDNMPDMLWAKDMNKDYIFANKSICNNLLGAIDTEEPLGKNDMFFAIRQRNSQPNNPQWHTFGEICRDSDSITMKELKPMQFDEFGNVKGKFLFLNVHKAPLYDDNGQLIGIVGSARDVTAAREAENQLRKLSQAVEQSPAAIVITNTEGIIEYVNPKFSEITGYTLREAIGKNPRILKSGEQPPEIYIDLWKTITSGQKWKGELHNKKKNGELFWESVFISPINSTCKCNF